VKTRQILHPPRPLAPTTVRLAQGSVGKCYPCSLCRKSAPHDRVICSTWLSTAGPSFSIGSITVLGTPSGVPWAQQSTLACRLPPSCSGRLVFLPSGTGLQLPSLKAFGAALLLGTWVILLAITSRQSRLYARNFSLPRLNKRRSYPRVTSVVLHLRKFIFCCPQDDKQAYRCDPTLMHLLSSTNRFLGGAEST
jgi:hypothetical protein